MNFKRVLIDGDVLVYRIGFTTEDVDEGIAKWRLDEQLENIMAACKVKESVIYITAADKSNFRFTLFPEYKANRAGKPKPLHYEFIRKTLVDDYMATVIHGEEADDALAKALTEDPDNQILASIDKDLDMVPGWHYNWVKGTVYKISELEGWRNFYWQCLVGDKSTDNIDGCPKIGVVKATRSLEGCESESEMFEKVANHYLHAYSDPDVAANALWLAGNLLWMRRKDDQPWVRPNGEVVSKTVLKDFYSKEESPMSMSLTSSST